MHTPTQHEIDHKARLALENLTPGGSEYHNDPERCTAWLQRIKSDCNDSKKEIVKLQRKIDALVEALERLVAVNNLISARLHQLGRDMGFAGSYDGTYPCAAHHVELDMATHHAEQLLGGIDDEPNRG